MNSVHFVYQGIEGRVEKLFRFHDDGLFDVEVTVAGRSDWGLLMGPGLRNPDASEFKGTYGLNRFASYLSQGEIETTAASKARELVQIPGIGMDWVGLEDTYFLSLLAPV